MWNPNADLTKLDQDFYARLYGPAAGPMRRYFKLLWHALATSGAEGGSSKRLEEAGKELATAETVAQEAKRPDIVEKNKAAGLFHRRCVEINATQRTNP
jgi:hypothetical protein